MRAYVMLPFDPVICKGAAQEMEAWLVRQPGVRWVYVNLPLEMAYITYDSTETDSGTLQALLSDRSMSTELERVADHAPSEERKPVQERSLPNRKWLSVLLLLFATVSLLLTGLWWMRF